MLYFFAVHTVIGNGDRLADVDALRQQPDIVQQAAAVKLDSAVMEQLLVDQFFQGFFIPGGGVLFQLPDKAQQIVAGESLYAN